MTPVSRRDSSASPSASASSAACGVASSVKTVPTAFGESGRQGQHVGCGFKLPRKLGCGTSLKVRGRKSPRNFRVHAETSRLGDFQLPFGEGLKSRSCSKKNRNRNPVRNPARRTNAGSVGGKAARRVPVQLNSAASVQGGVYFVRRFRAYGMEFFANRSANMVTLSSPAWGEVEVHFDLSSCDAPLGAFVDLLVSYGLVGSELVCGALEAAQRGTDFTDLDTDVQEFIGLLIDVGWCAPVVLDGAAFDA